MAFYTSRVDAAGNEIERRCFSVSSARPSTCASSAPSLAARKTFFRRLSPGLHEFTDSQNMRQIDRPDDDDEKLYHGPSSLYTIKNLTYRKYGSPTIGNEMKQLSTYCPSAGLSHKRSTGAIRKEAVGDNKSVGQAGDFANPSDPSLGDGQFNYSLNQAVARRYINSTDATEDELDDISTRIPANVTYRKRGPSRIKNLPEIATGLCRSPKGAKNSCEQFNEALPICDSNEYGTNQPKRPCAQNLFKKSPNVLAARLERGCPPLNIREHVDQDHAYQKWLSAKKKLRNDQLTQKKAQEEQKKRELEDRKMKSEERYQLWLQSKVSKPRETLKILPNRHLVKQKPDKYDENHRSATLQQWEQKKRTEEAKRRTAEREKQKRSADLEEQRRAMAANAWEEWNAEAANKPKPVPLGQGMFTLRGTVSAMFVNPNKWQKDIPSDGEE